MENHPAAQKKCGKASSSLKPTVSRDRRRSSGSRTESLIARSFMWAPAYRRARLGRVALEYRAGCARFAERSARVILDPGHHRAELASHLLDLVALLLLSHALEVLLPGAVLGDPLPRELA